MGLRDLNLQISYGPSDDRLKQFFIPAMEASVRYERAAGYFSSTTLAVAAKGVARLISNGGTMRLLVGADLSEDDVEAIRKGADLAQRVAGRLKGRLMIVPEVLIKRRLEALAWMVSVGQLDIRVVLPTGPDGHPLPASRSESYYHPKEGVFTDAEGNQIAFSGSINESATAIEDNYETFCVYFGWNESKPYLAQVRRRFDNLWEHREPNWISMPIPEAVKQELLRYRPAMAPTRDPEEPAPPPEQAAPSAEHVAADQRERILFQFVRDAPYLLGDKRLGMATCVVKPWPHQVRVADTLIERFPERFMLCDEVGLGKTIECGLALRQLVLSERARRVLILVPKSVLRQWQEELYEKFVLDVPCYDGQTFRNYAKDELPCPAENPWDAYPVLLSSSHLARRVERQEQLLQAQDWDLVVIDEAHHARRKDFLNREQYRPNRLLELLRDTGGRPGLHDKTRGLWLLTATPMQIDPVEVWDLLKVLELGGRWGANEANFLRYFDELRCAQDDFEATDWDFVLRMLADYFALGGTWDEQFCAEVERRLGFVEWEQIKQFAGGHGSTSALRQLSKLGRAILIEVCRRHSPLRQYMFRNTRSLLREYRKRGLLTENVPDRDPKPQFIPMKPDEEALYRRIEEYIRHFYQRYEAERTGLGFIMTVYRRRLTSSFYAMRCSLERRLACLKGEHAELLDDDDWSQEEQDPETSEWLMPVGEEPSLRRLLVEELRYVEDFLDELRRLQSDSKMEQLETDLAALLRRRETILVFTQYTDTMDYVRDRLRHVYGAQVACYSGRGGELWDGTKWVGTSKERIKNLFRDKEIKILLCTESASEGLNLQTCGVLINYDMPWNPMRVEQRIGRIDRIGQVHTKVWIRNYFYEGTVEADIYHRLDERITSFESVVGELQPILARVGRVIQQAAVASVSERERLLREEIAAINTAVRGREVAALNIDQFVDAAVVPAKREPVPVTLPELAQLILESKALGARFQPHPELRNAWLLDWGGEFRSVTFDAEVFDAHPNSTTLLSFGSSLLRQVLDAVDRPDESGREGVIARCAVSQPRTCVGYYGLNEGDVHSIATLSEIPARRTVSGPLASAHLAKARNLFVGAASKPGDDDTRASSLRRRAALTACEEECRRLLLDAAYIELARSANPELFDETPPADFSPDAIERLRRHGFPFSAVLRVVGMHGLCPNPADNTYRRLTTLRRDALDRRFAGVTSKLEEALRALVEARDTLSNSRPQGSTTTNCVVATYAPCPIDSHQGDDNAG
jgi:superfamily II DNA or RNA helicase